MISYVLPTRDRHDVLRETLDAIGGLARHDAQVIVVDNASQRDVCSPGGLANGVACSVIRLEQNLSTAARNVGVQRAIEVAGCSNDHWIVMLDDDSVPLDIDMVDGVMQAPRDVGAIAAEIFLPMDSDGQTRHEAGGLPEVFTGCGAAIRACDFVDLGGYDATFDYYAEEYDFCARLLLAGMRVVHDRRFRVMHRKVGEGRDLGRIIGNLARNNAWVMARYAPDQVRQEMIDEQLARYERIALKEGVIDAYRRAVTRDALSLDSQPRRAMSREVWERFTGLAAAREHLSQLVAANGWMTCKIVHEGKGAEVVAIAAAQSGMRVVDGDNADVRVVGSLSPGVMVDVLEREGGDHGRVVGAWGY